MHHDPLSLLESSPRVQIMVQITRQHSLEREIRCGRHGRMGDVVVQTLEGSMEMFTDCSPALERKVKRRE